MLSVAFQGCYEKAKQFVGEQADILVGCTFAFSFSLVSLCVYQSITGSSNNRSVLKGQVVIGVIVTE